MIKRKLNGFYKRVGSSSDFETNQCPFCQTDFENIRSLYDQPNPQDCVDFAKRKDSMETTIYQCPQCKRFFVYWETLDYDYFHLMEIESVEVE